MSYSTFEKALGIILAVIAAFLALPLVIIIRISTFIASIPSRIGERIRVEGWIYRGIKTVVDVDLMREFRDDIFSRIRPHIVFEEEFERWYIIREMEKDIQRINSSLVNGEYAIIVLISLSSILVESSVYGVSASVLLTLFALVFSGLIITRLVTMKILIFKPELYMNEPVHDLTVRMAFNRGAISRGASVGLTIMTVLIGLSNGLGYEKGLDFIEWYAERSHPGNKGKWKSTSN